MALSAVVAWLALVAVPTDNPELVPDTPFNVPPVIDTLLAFCVDMVPRPNTALETAVDTVDPTNAVVAI